jgi:hypothetical protein
LFNSLRLTPIIPSLSHIFSLLKFLSCPFFFTPNSLYQLLTSLH